MAQLMPTINFQYYEPKFVSYVLNVLIIESCLSVRYICFQITDMGLSTTIDSREQIQRKVVQLVLHNMVKGGWWKVALHNKQKNIVGLMHKVGHLQDMVGNNGN
jgi:hypothetical protein